ncbi:hypothetical protein HO173_009379 [Letharia columbiana]|uniref:Uncharacterized protein n=1 Tax=Letharia columbiana TaxID=112416 RepID=A0A8H6FPE4_9LECA|nr:uncharacterized protein HO173_009379 [Letharia columbiana]KAF6232274.1 hypothetical protein HO173_009379 [Letharia columbiana]
MGCAPSRPSNPVPRPRRQTDEPRKPNNSRLSRPFDPNIPLYVPHYQHPSVVPPVDPARYGDAYAQLNGRSKQKRAPTPYKARQSVRPVDPERYGDAYAQLNARSATEGRAGLAQGSEGAVCPGPQGQESGGALF